MWAPYGHCVKCDIEIYPATLIDSFWAALGIQQEWMTKPEVMYDEDELIWKMTAKEGYLFDDSFWEVFQEFPFKICHVSYSGAPWSHEGGPPEMVIRFTPSQNTADFPSKWEEMRWCEAHDSNWFEAIGIHSGCGWANLLRPCVEGKPRQVFHD